MQVKKKKPRLFRLKYDITKEPNSYQYQNSIIKYFPAPLILCNPTDQL